MHYLRAAPEGDRLIIGVFISLFLLFIGLFLYFSLYCVIKISRNEYTYDRGSYYFHDEKNPVLNSPDDISQELIDKIILNRLKSITINYPFTECEDYTDRFMFMQPEYPAPLFPEKNPFRIADSQSGLVRIEFKVLFGPEVTTLDCAFSDFEHLDSADISVGPNIRSMAYMFANTPKFNSPVNHWDTSSVVSMRGLFYNVHFFNQPVYRWDTSHVSSMKRMFMNAKSFNQSVYRWNIYSVSDMREMFKNASSFNQSVYSWNIGSKITKNMFDAATSYRE